MERREVVGNRNRHAGLLRCLPSSKASHVELLPRSSPQNTTKSPRDQNPPPSPYLAVKSSTASSVSVGRGNILLTPTCSSDQLKTSLGSRSPCAVGTLRGINPQRPWSTALPEIHLRRGSPRPPPRHPRRTARGSRRPAGSSQSSARGKPRSPGSLQRA